ncbi:hypothetical protein [Oceaniglobus indicus]|uniref:hypothetical protein n=1 Tax=Oceaniglobus indicus TaxID=2047749 RepID=UPI0013042F08|nr:hypothetical protein [Oceaniglobus indicus]
MTFNSQTRGDRPPPNALRVKAWRDLPANRTPARYKITADSGDTHQISVAKGNRIILDALIEQPVYCASPVRISDRVCILRHEYGVPIIKEMYENDAATDRAKFGVYFLNAKVERVSGGGGAA